MKQLKTFWIINALAMLVSATAVNGAPPEIVLAVPTAFEFEGYTTQTTKGGETGGIVGMNALCQQEFGAQARMCTTKEWRETKRISQPFPGEFGAWAQPDIIEVYVDPTSGLIVYLDSSTTQFTSGTSATLTCELWRTSDALSLGVFVFDEPPANSAIGRGSCSGIKNVACCVPATVTPTVVK